MLDDKSGRAVPVIFPFVFQLTLNFCHLFRSFVQLYFPDLRLQLVLRHYLCYSNSSFAVSHLRSVLWSVLWLIAIDFYMAILLFTICHLLFSICHFAFVICCLSSCFSHSWLAVVIRCLPLCRCYSSISICLLLFVNCNFSYAFCRFLVPSGFLQTCRIDDIFSGWPVVTGHINRSKGWKGYQRKKTNEHK